MNNLKDPAFLFYPESFLVGTMDMTAEEVGIYIRLLCRQHQKGHIKPALMENVSDEVKAKFVLDENGLYYNERLEREIEARKNFTTSRRKNGASGGRPRNPEYCGLTKKEWEALPLEERIKLTKK